MNPEWQELSAWLVIAAVALVALIVIAVQSMGIDGLIIIACVFGAVGSTAIFMYRRGWLP